MSFLSAQACMHENTNTCTHTHTTETWRSYIHIETAASLLACTKSSVYTFSFEVYADLKCESLQKNSMHMYSGTNVDLSEEIGMNTAANQNSSFNV